MPKDKESTTKLKIDATDFKRGITEANRALKLANSEFKASTAHMDDWSKSTEGQQAKLKQLNAVMDAEKKKLELIKAQYDKVVAAQGKNSAEAENLKIRMNNQQAAVGKAEAELKKYNDKLKQADTSTKDLTASEEKADTQTKDLGEQFTTSKVALGNFISDGIEVGVKKLLELAGAAKEAYKEFDAGADAVIKATGATGEAAASLKSSYETVAKNVKGELSDLGSIVGEVNTRFGFTDEKLEKCAITFQKFAQITDTDAKTAVQLVSRAMEKAGIESDRYEEVLDKLAYASQVTGVDVSKLAQNLADNGSAFKQLGLDVDAQIGLLASFERGGVNVSAALGGMKKAVGNWAKEGKNANTEFKKTMDMIQKAPSDTEAARIAVETFGAKSGVELAEAMRTGKFSYDDFAKSLKSSSKTVENTYNGTQDGLDKIDLAAQSLKVDVAKAFGDLIDENEENIDEFINYIKTNVIPKGKAVISWTVENFGKIMTIAKGAGTAIAAIWVINKAASFAQGIQNGITALNGLSTSAKTAKTSQEGLNAAQSASPVMLLVKGAALLASGIATLINLSADNIEVVEEETDAYKDLHDQIEKNADAWSDESKSRDDNVKKANAEFDYLEKLKAELDTLVDQNGKVKKGYEDRAKVITDKLSEATGIEIQNNGKVIDSYKKVSAEIDNVIKKKRAQAIASANESLYTTAVTDQNQYYNDFVQSLNAYTKSNKEIDQIKGRMTELDRLIKSAYSAGRYQEEGEYRKEYSQLESRLKEATKQKSTNWTNYNKARKTYEEAAATIQNYEALEVALQSGDEKKINDALDNLQNKFKHAETSTKKSLENQRDEYQKHYDLLKQQLEKNTPGITQAMVDQAKEMCDKSVAELEKWKKDYSEAGNLNAGAYTSGFSSQESKEKATASANSMSDKVINTIKQRQADYEEQAETWVQGFSTTMKTVTTGIGIPMIGEIATKMATKLKNESVQASAAASEWAQKFYTSFNTAIEKLNVNNKSLVERLKDSASTTLTAQFMQNMNDIYGSVNSSSPVTVNNFYQTNNSPKSLSSYETGRQAQNVFSLYVKK